MYKRIRNNKLKEKVMSLEQAAELVEDGMIIATSGFTPVGYPKAVPLALAKRIKDNKEKLQISLLTGASVGEELDGALTDAGIIARRYPYQTNKLLRNNINSGKIAYADIHLSHFAQQVRYGFFGEIDLAIIEAIAIDEEGNIIPSTSVGVSPTFIDRAKSIEVIQDSVLDLIDSGKIRIASGTSLTFSKEGQQRFINNLKEYKRKIILRPQEISNNPEIIRRLGSIAMNTAIEVDIYGNVNSTNIMGTKMMNGIGGSGDFARNAYLSIFVTLSIAKNGDISCVVPMVSHVDHTEHDVQVIVTEQGLADLRGLSPRERAETIINNCTHPEYKHKLEDYYQRALGKGGHTPHLIEESLS